MVGAGDSGSVGMANELFTSENQWITLSVDSPANITYPLSYVLPLNSTHIFFNGGDLSGGFVDDVLAETWILDLANLVWTPSMPMLTPRFAHGCVTTDGPPDAI